MKRYFVVQDRTLNFARYDQGKKVKDELIEGFKRDKEDVRVRLRPRTSGFDLVVKVPRDV